MAMYVNGAWSCAEGSGGSYTFRNNLTNSSGTVDFTPLDSTVMNAVDDFLPSTSLTGKIGTLGWGVTPINSGCPSSYMTAGQANHPGIFILSSGTSSGEGCSFTLSDSLSGPAYPFVNLGSGGAWSYWEAQAIFQTDVDAVSHTIYVIGFSDNDAAYHPANGNEIAVRYDSTGNGGCPSNESSTNWVYEVIVSGTKSCYNSGLPVAANTWYHVRLYSATPGTLQFQINGTYSGSIAAAPTAAMAPQFINITSSAAGQAGLFVDWWAMKMQGLVR